MTGIPTLQVLLDDGTGTYPQDVTGLVRLPDGIQPSRGRSDELSDNQPGNLSLTLEATSIGLGFGGGGFGGGGFGGTLNTSLDQSIRVKIAGNTVWTGKLQSLPVAWPTGGDEFALQQLTATDALAVMARRTLQSATIEETAIDAADLLAYWPCNEESGVMTVAGFGLSAHDYLGKAPSLHAITDGLPITYPQFGSSTGMPDGSTGVGVTAAGSNTVYFGLNSGELAAPNTSSLHFEFVFNSSATPAFGVVAYIPEQGNPTGGLVVFLSNTGRLSLTRSVGTESAYNIGPANSCDGKPHHIAIETDATSTHVFVDGALNDSRAGLAGPIVYKLGGGISFLCAGGSPVAGTMAHISIAGTKLSDARALARGAAVMTDLAGETPAVRIARILTYNVGIAAGTIDTAGSTTCGAASQSGKSALAAVLDTAQADLGSAFADKNGTLSYIAGRTFAATAVPTATIDANWCDVSTTVLNDMTGVVNDVTGTTPATGNLYRRTNAASVATHGTYPDTPSWNVSTDAQMQSRTNWTLNTYANPQPRVATLTLDLLTMDPTTLSAVTALDLGSYLRVTGMPSQTPGGTQLDVIVEGIQWEITEASYSVVLNVVQRSLVGAWVLGNTSYSVLGSTTKLAA